MQRILFVFIIALLVSCGRNAPLPTPPVPATATLAAPTQTAIPSPTVQPVTATPEGWCALSLEGFAVIGYLPEYREVNMEWGKCLTDIIYFSAEPRADGALDASRLDEETWESLRSMKQEYGTRVHLSIGGWERSQGFASMTANPMTRKAFIENLLGYVIAHQLDGVDFDWEFPEGKSEFENYIAFLTEAKDSFSPRGLSVSVALSADNASSMDLSQFDVVDRVHVMAYDQGALHSPYYMAIEDLNTFSILGLPKSKLFLGVPFYGRLITSPFTAFSYQEIVEKYHPSQEIEQVDDIFFNGVATIQYKTCFVSDNDFGGIMIWELGQDTWDATSLLRAIHQAAASGCAHLPGAQ